MILIFLQNTDLCFRVVFSYSNSFTFFFQQHCAELVPKTPSTLHALPCMDVDAGRTLLGNQCIPLFKMTYTIITLTETASKNEACLGETEDSDPLVTLKWNCGSRQQDQHRHCANVLRKQERALPMPPQAKRQW